MVALVTRAPLSLGPAALEMRVTEHQLRKALARRVIVPPRFGRYAMFPVNELPAYRKAMEEAGIVDPVAAPVSDLATA